MLPLSPFLLTIPLRSFLLGQLFAPVEPEESDDRFLENAGWKVQDYRRPNIAACLALQPRVPAQLKPADYLLFVEKHASLPLLRKEI